MYSINPDDAQFWDESDEINTTKGLVAMKTSHG